MVKCGSEMRQNRLGWSGFATIAEVKRRQRSNTPVWLRPALSAYIQKMLMLMLMLMLMISR